MPNTVSKIEVVTTRYSRTPPEELERERWQFSLSGSSVGRSSTLVERVGTYYTSLEYALREARRLGYSRVTVM